MNAWMGMENSPRDLILYNYYTNVDFYTFDMWVNGSFAIRDTQFKLMHAFNSTTYAIWYNTESIDEDDDALDADVRCAPQAGFNDGEFTYWLFDLINDPYETTNLYYSEELYVKTARETLYSKLPGFFAKSKTLEYPTRGNLAAFQVWFLRLLAYIPCPLSHHDPIGIFVCTYALLPGLEGTRRFHSSLCHRRRPQ